MGDRGMQAKCAVDSGGSGGCGEESRIGHGDAAGEVDDKILKDVCTWWAEARPHTHARTHAASLCVCVSLSLHLSSRCLSTHTPSSSHYQTCTTGRPTCCCCYRARQASQSQGKLEYHRAATSDQRLVCLTAQGAAVAQRWLHHRYISKYLPFPVHQLRYPSTGALFFSGTRCLSESLSAENRARDPQACLLPAAQGSRPVLFPGASGCPADSERS